MDGILLIDKPADWTSHDVVAKIRGIIRAETGHKVKVGHTGTLDPFATGLLVLVLGGYTKRAEEFSKLDKVYETEVMLGAVSNTGDLEGQITPKSTQKPSENDVKAVLSTFLGEIEQIPPAFSAVKIGGRRAYKLAREGKDVKIKSRKVKIYEMSDVKYVYPKLKFTCIVSSGTYIRSLAADIGEQLSTGAYLSALRRARVGSYKLNEALKADGLTADVIKQHLAN